MIKLIDLLKESININNGTVVYHTSFKGELKSFLNKPTWFTTRPAIADAYHKINKGNITYECELAKGKYLSPEEAKIACDKFGIDWNDFQTSLVARVNNDVSSLEGIKKFKTICDGFFHRDYDPRDSRNSYFSLLVLDPVKNIKIIKTVY